MNETLKILLVEDNPYDAELLQSMLKKSAIAHSIKHVGSFQELVPVLANDTGFDLILLDLNLPDSNGLETIVKVTECAYTIPIVVLTSLDNEELSYSAIQAGAQDYLIKGKTDVTLLKKTLFHSCYRYQIVNKINQDSEQQRAYLATHDILTNLPKEQVFLEQLQNIILRSSVAKSTFAIVLLHLHEMDQIEQNFSALSRDKVIKTMSSKLIKEKNHTFGVYRVKEVIFAIILYKVDNINTIENYINALQHKLNFTVTIEDREYSPLYSISSAVYPFDGYDSKQLLSAAFSSLKRAKNNGYNNYEIFNKNIVIKSEPLILHTEILNAINRNEFCIYYQPQLNIQTNNLHGLEALIRWQHPKLGLISPDLFIPIAEEHRLITALGEWVVKAVCHKLQQWEKKLITQIIVSIDINISIHQLEFSNLYNFIENTLNQYEIFPELFGIELTESVFLSEPEKVINKLHDLKNLGIKLAIDDFGKGYSSLSYLNHLPLDYLKLDIDFIKDINISKEKQYIVNSVIQLAHDLNIKVIAEGVENLIQKKMLEKFNCDIIQGFWYSKPLPAHIIENKFLNKLPKQ